jgi:hypothetical protein
MGFDPSFFVLTELTNPLPYHNDTSRNYGDDF